MTIDQPCDLLGGLSPERFMRRHWQRKPLLVRGAWPGVRPPLARAQLFELASREDVESRLICRQRGSWTLRHGPLPRRALPSLQTREWTLLVQGLDLHEHVAREMLSRFRFVPEARLDDLMISFATDGGGVGPHLDSYDVFLLQVHGRRRWRIGRVPQARWIEDAPLKLLARFEPEHEWVLEPGDMLYLPPLWGHDGIAEGECVTCSIGFRAPARRHLAREVLQRLAEAGEDDAGDRLYRDPGQSATDMPGLIPPSLQRFAADAVADAIRAGAVAAALGEVLTEPKPRVWFEDGEPLVATEAVELDRRSRMMYDDRHVFINGESFRASGRDATLMRRLADRRRLSAAEVARLSDDARELLAQWAADGWARALDDPGSTKG
ncbi:MAG TPA: cupin domain-containing protein [Burkholderiaceae bacterium]|nr:cupin domain-containing protein [Burkholderiaceae bacterium]